MIRKIIASSRMNGRQHLEAGGSSAIAERAYAWLQPLHSNTLLRIPVVGVFHAVLFAIVYRLAYELRFDFTIPPDHVPRLLASLPWIILIKTLVFGLMGCFHSSWRYVTFADLTALLKASGISFAVIVGFDHFVLDYQIPRAVVILDTVLGLLLVCGFRAGWRLCDESNK